MSKVYSSCFVLFVVTLGGGVVIPLLPYYIDALGASKLDVGIIFAMFALARLIALLTVSYIIHRIGSFNTLMLGISIYVVASFMYVHLPNVHFLNLTRFLHGFGSGLLHPIIFSYIGFLSKEGGEGQAMGRANLFFLAGVGFGPILGGVLYELIGYNYTFYTLGVMAFMGMLLITRYHRYIKTDIKREVPPIFDANIVGVGVMRFSYAFVVGILWTFMPFVIIDITEKGEMVSGIFLSTLVLVGAFVQVHVGKLTDHYNTKIMIAIGSIATGAFLVFLPFVETVHTFFLFGILIGLSGSFVTNAAMAQITIIGKKSNMGGAMSALMIYHSLGFFLSPLITGILATVMTISTVFVVYGFCLFFAGLLFYFIKSDKILYPGG